GADALLRPKLRLDVLRNIEEAAEERVVEQRVPARNLRFADDREVDDRGSHLLQQRRERRYLAVAERPRRGPEPEPGDERRAGERPGGERCELAIHDGILGRFAQRLECVTEQDACHAQATVTGTGEAHEVQYLVRVLRNDRSKER